MKLPNSNSIFLMKSDMRCLWTLRARRTTLPDTAKTAMQPALKEFSIVFCSLFLCFFQERSKDNGWFERNVKDEVEQREKMHSENPRNLVKQTGDRILLSDDPTEDSRNPSFIFFAFSLQNLPNAITKNASGISESAICFCIYTHIYIQSMHVYAPFVSFLAKCR